MIYTLYQIWQGYVSFFFKYFKVSLLYITTMVFKLYNFGLQINWKYKFFKLIVYNTFNQHSNLYRLYRIIRIYQYLIKVLITLIYNIISIIIINNNVII